MAYRKEINMKRKIIGALLVVGIMGSILAGCGENEEALTQRCNELKTEIALLETQKEELETEIVDIKEENGTAKYVVTFNIKQSHFTLDIGEHLKDSMNDISIEIPVDKEYYDSVSVGDTIDDSFRIGSLLMKGSFGSWDVTVENKEVR